MSRLLHAELLKVRTVRTLLWIALAMVLIILLAAISVAVSSAQAATAADDRSIARISAVAVVFALLSGIVVFGSEGSSGTITQTLLVAPVRERVLLAKAGVAVAVGLPVDGHVQRYLLRRRRGIQRLLQDHRQGWTAAQLRLPGTPHRQRHRRPDVDLRCQEHARGCIRQRFTGLPNRSAHRPTKKTGQPPKNAAKPMTGLLSAEIEYPQTTNGFRWRNRSDSAPPIQRNPLLIPSATPSINPRIFGDAPSTPVTNSGMIG